MPKRWVFKPRISLTIITILCLILFIRLGFWQIHRYHEKINSNQNYLSHSKLPAVDIKHISIKQQINYYPLKVTGYFDNHYQLLLDNRIYQHRVGYEVLTLFRPLQDNQAILVNRGFVPRTTTRDQLPIIKPVTEQLTLQGVLLIPHKNTFSLGPVIENPGKWPMIVEVLNLEQLSKMLGVKLYPYILLLKASEPHGFVRDWQPITGLPPQQHLSYAVQWFSFALVLVIIFFGLSFKRDKLS